MKKDFDVFVIGSGIAGQTVAETCVQNKLNVAIADQTVFGGTCANRGCDPKKVLYAATKSIYLNNNLREKNILSKSELNWEALQTFKKEFTDAVPASTEKRLLKLGVTLYHQSPSFIDQNTLSVEGKTVSAEHIVIATGRIPRPLDIEGQSYLKTSRDFLNLKKLPESIVFIGGGYVGMEFAHMAARAGSKVTVIERGEKILKPFDSDLTDMLLEASKAIGIKFIFNADVEQIEKLQKNYRISYKESNETKTLKARLVFNTTGRIPSLDKLKLSKIGLTTSSKGVEVNSYLQSKEYEHIYACGDVSSLGKPLTPLSGQQGKIVAHNILNEKKKSFDADVVASNVFTIPNLASVGLSEEEAQNRYKTIDVKSQSINDWFSAKHANHKTYAYKIIVNQRNDQILGAHLLSPMASELINLIAMAIKHEMTTADIKSLNFSYPSWGNDIKYML